MSTKSGKGDFGPVFRSLGSVFRVPTLIPVNRHHEV